MTRHKEISKTTCLNIIHPHLWPWGKKQPIYNTWLDKNICRNKSIYRAMWNGILVSAELQTFDIDMNLFLYIRKGSPSCIWRWFMICFLVMTPNAALMETYPGRSVHGSLRLLHLMPLKKQKWITPSLKLDSLPHQNWVIEGTFTA